MSKHSDERPGRILARLALTIPYFYFLIVGIRLLFFGVLWGTCDPFEGECGYGRLFGTLFGVIALVLAFTLALIGNAIGRSWSDPVTRIVHRRRRWWPWLPVLLPLLGYGFAGITGIGVSATGEYVFREDEANVGVVGVDGLPEHLSIHDLTVAYRNYPTISRVSPQGVPARDATTAMPEERPEELSNCCETLPRRWRPQRRYLRWRIRDWRRCETVSYQGDIAIEKYEKPGRLWVVFTRTGRVRIVAAAQPSASEMLSWGVTGKPEQESSRCEGKWQNLDDRKEFTSNDSLIS